MVPVKRVFDIIRNDGIFRLFAKVPGYIYRNSIRKVLPVKERAIYNGIPVNRPIVAGDALFGEEGNWYPHDFDRERYETALVKGLRTYCNEGDTVVVVGGGWGVTTTVAAKQVGTTGRVITYEGAFDQVDNTRSTAELNNVKEKVEINHAIVSESISLRGEAAGAEIVSPTELPACDVLELDCEGAELDIIKGIDITPRVILVESHGMFESSTANVRQALTDKGYTITEEAVAEADDISFCEDNDVKVLFAVKDS